MIEQQRMPKPLSPRLPLEILLQVIPHAIIPSSHASINILLISKLFYEIGLPVFVSKLVLSTPLKQKHFYAAHLSGLIPEYPTWFELVNSLEIFFTPANIPWSNRFSIVLFPNLRELVYSEAPMFGRMGVSWTENGFETLFCLDNRAWTSGSGMFKLHLQRGHASKLFNRFSHNFESFAKFVDILQFSIQLHPVESIDRKEFSVDPEVITKRFASLKKVIISGSFDESSLLIFEPHSLPYWKFLSGLPESVVFQFDISLTVISSQSSSSSPDTTPFDLVRFQRQIFKFVEAQGQNITRRVIWTVNAVQVDPAVDQESMEMVAREVQVISVAENHLENSSDDDDFMFEGLEDYDDEEDEENVEDGSDEEGEESIDEYQQHDGSKGQ